MINHIYITGAMLLVFSLIPSSKGEESVDWRNDVFVAGQDGYHTYRIPALAVSSKGTILAFCEGRRNSQADHGDIDLLLKRSTDGGRTWSEAIVVQAEKGKVTIGNPCPIIVRDAARIHLLFTRDNKRMFYTYSDDDGLTWSKRLDLTAILDGFDYPERVLIATGPVHGIQTTNGRLIAPVWLSDREMNRRHRDQVFTRIRAGIVFSDDNGETWQAGGLVPAEMNRLHEATVVELSDGSLMINMRVFDMKSGFRAVSTSQDGGETWSSPTLDKQLPCPVCQGAMLSLGGGKVLFLNPAHSNTTGKWNASLRKDLTLRLSLDDARTWPHSVVVHQGPAGYSDVATVDSGEILCLFENGDEDYQERISMAGISTERLMQSSLPVGGSL